MKARSRHWSLALATVSLLLGGGAAGAEERAEALFYGGADSGIFAQIAGQGMKLPARRFPCANCHGRDGQGGAEGARRIPALVAPPRPSALDAEELFLALTEGRSPKGVQLDRLMPRYLVDRADATALAGFLAALPQVERRGAAPAEITFLLPRNDAVEGLLQDFSEGFDAGIAGRKVWGREIRLSRDAADPAFATVALQAKVSEDPGLPLLTPLGPVETGVAPIRPFCAPPEAQIAALVQALPKDQPVAVQGQGGFADRIRATLREQGRYSEEPSHNGAALLLLDRAESALPPGADLLALADLTGREAAAALAAQGHRVRLSDGCAAIAELAQLDPAEKAQKLGELTGVAVWEALSAAGRNLSRSGFLAALDRRAAKGSVGPGPDGAQPILTLIPNEGASR